MNDRGVALLPRERIGHGAAVRHRIADDAETRDAEPRADGEAIRPPREDLPHAQVEFDGDAAVGVLERRPHLLRAERDLVGTPGVVLLDDREHAAPLVRQHLAVLEEAQEHVPVLGEPQVRARVLGARELDALDDLGAGPGMAHDLEHGPARIARVEALVPAVGPHHRRLELEALLEDRDAVSLLREAQRRDTPAEARTDDDPVVMLAAIHPHLPKKAAEE